MGTVITIFLLLVIVGGVIGLISAVRIRRKPLALLMRSWQPIEMPTGADVVGESKHWDKLRAAGISETEVTTSRAMLFPNRGGGLDVRLWNDAAGLLVGWVDWDASHVLRPHVERCVRQRIGVTTPVQLHPFPLREGGIGWQATFELPDRTNRQADSVEDEA